MAFESQKGGEGDFRLKINPARAHELSSANEPAQPRKLKPGIDPILDRWIETNSFGDRDERARLSALIW